MKNGQINNFRNQSLPLLLALTFLMLMPGETLAKDARITNLLPAPSAIKGLIPEGRFKLAEGEKLYEIINGGAALYLRQQFQEAVFQDYKTNNGRLITLEIYRMGSPTNARAIFESKKSVNGAELSIGDAGWMAEYYCLLQQGPYFVSITGNQPSDNLRRALVEMANQVSATLIRVGPR